MRHNLPSGQNFERTYQYDDYCRAHQVTTKVDGNNYISKVLYDGNYGRVKGKQYPNGLVVAYQYDLNTGYLNETKNAVDGTVYRKIEAVDALGNWTQAKLSNNAISINRAFDLQGGQMRSTELKKGSLVQQLINYSAYDGFGNLETVEASTRIGNTFYSDVESYQYDDLHRLTRSTLTQSGSLRNEYFYNYDKVGNFQYKTDFSTSASNAYRFGNKDKNLGGNAGPNAVRQVALANGRGNRYYQYDNNGNLTNDGTRNIVYNAFNKPTQITVSSNMRLQPYDSSLTSAASLNFFYGADQMRYKQVKTAGSTSTTTIYIDKSYEKITQGSTVTHKAYVDDIAVVTQVGSSTNLETTYFHKDRLGSTIASVNANGDISNYHSFDPFGKPRDGRMNDNKTSSAIAVNILNDDKTTRGFTDHEHLDDAQLIHMNGRVYDYNLGRFLSVDPFIQEPGNSQSMNPYSYIMNNPLAGTDPSGYLAERNGRCEGGDYACQWDKSMGIITGLGKGPITAMYNGIAARESAVRKKASAATGVAPEKINVELKFDEATEEEYAIVTFTSGGTEEKSSSKFTARDIRRRGSGGYARWRHFNNLDKKVQQQAKDAGGVWAGAVLIFVPGPEDYVLVTWATTKAGKWLAEVGDKAWSAIRGAKVTKSVTKTKNFKINTLEIEDNVAHLSIRGPDGNSTDIFTNFVKNGDTVTFDKFHVGELGVGSLGRQGINEAAQALGKHFGAKKLIIQGGQRSTGKMKGKTPKPKEFIIE